MGIGRRDFLKAFSAAIAAFATRPLQPVVTGGDYYINRSLGLALRQPPGWTYLSLKEFPDLKHAQVLEDGDISDLLLSGSEPYLVMNRLDPARPGSFRYRAWIRSSTSRDSSSTPANSRRWPGKGAS